MAEYRPLDKPVIRHTVMVGEEVTVIAGVSLPAWVDRSAVLPGSNGAIACFVGVVDRVGYRWPLTLFGRAARRRNGRGRRPQPHGAGRSRLAVVALIEPEILRWRWQTHTAFVRWRGPSRDGGEETRGDGRTRFQAVFWCGIAAF